MRVISNGVTIQARLRCALAIKGNATIDESGSRSHYTIICRIPCGMFRHRNTCSSGSICAVGVDISCVSIVRITLCKMSSKNIISRFKIARSISNHVRVRHCKLNTRILKCGRIGQYF